MQALSWQEVVARKDSYVGGQAELEGCMVDGSILRARITSIETQDGMFVIRFGWIALRKVDEWGVAPKDAVPPIQEECSLMMDSSFVPVRDLGDGTIEWSIAGMAPGRMFPKGHPKLLRTGEIKGHTPHAETAESSASPL